MRIFTEYDQQIKVRLFPWVHSFLIEKGYFIQNTIITEKNIVGMYLLALIGDNKPVYRCKMEGSIVVTVSLYLPKWTAFQTNAYLNSEKEFDFNKYCERLMKQELFSNLDFSCTYTDKEIKGLIYDFLDMYSIADGPINYDSLKKAYYREKKEREKMFSQIVPHNLNIKNSYGNKTFE
jgi:hypothetical protein